MGILVKGPKVTIQKVKIILTEGHHTHCHNCSPDYQCQKTFPCKFKHDCVAQKCYGSIDHYCDTHCEVHCSHNCKKKLISCLFRELRREMDELIDSKFQHSRTNPNDPWMGKDLRTVKFNEEQNTFF